jgi:hypothetical protein
LRASTPPGAGPDGDQRLARVVLTRQEGADLHLVDRLLERGDLAAHLAQRPGVVLGLGELQQHAGVVEPAAQALQLVDLVVDVGELGCDVLRARLVVPEVGCARRLLERRLLRAQGVDIEDGLDVAQGGVEGLELFGEIGSGHDRQDYAGGPSGPPA